MDLISFRFFVKHIFWVFASFLSVSVDSAESNLQCGTLTRSAISIKQKTNIRWFGQTFLCLFFLCVSSTSFMPHAFRLKICSKFPLTPDSHYHSVIHLEIRVRFQDCKTYCSMSTRQDTFFSLNLLQI